MWVSVGAWGCELGGLAAVGSVPWRVLCTFSCRGAGVGFWCCCVGLCEMCGLLCRVVVFGWAWCGVMWYA